MFIARLALAQNPDAYTPIGNLTIPGHPSRRGRYGGQAATLLPDGTVLQSGGCCQEAAAEIYHPAVLAPSPKLFSLAGDGRGPGPMLHAGTERIVSPSDPAITGEALEFTVPLS